MTARTPSVANAAIELGFVLVAGALGVAHAPIWSVVAVAVAMIGYWIWNCRAGLAQLAQGGALKLAAMAGVSLAIIVAILGCAYWFGGIMGSLK